jgi:hypothetical protein
MTTRSTLDEHRALAHAYLDRPHLSPEEGLARLRRRYPNASEKLLDALRFHLLVDLPGALVDLMAEMELFLREDDRPLDLFGEATHLVYHLYNYSLLESLVPTGREELFDLVRAAKECLDGDDREGASNTITKLQELIESSVVPPSIV